MSLKNSKTLVSLSDTRMVTRINVTYVNKSTTESTIKADTPTKVMLSVDEPLRNKTGIGTLGTFMPIYRNILVRYAERQTL